MLSRRVGLKAGAQMVRKTPMARGTSQLSRNTKSMAPVGQRAKRMRQGKVAPTVDESVWMDATQAYGCIVCRLHLGLRADAEIHHLKSGDRRRGHLWTIGLCAPHHRIGDGDGMFISRHPWKKRFEAAYGTEAWLLTQLRAALSTTITLPILPDPKYFQK